MIDCALGQFKIISIVIFDFKKVKKVPYIHNNIISALPSPTKLLRFDTKMSITVLKKLKVILFAAKILNVLPCK